jgi:hypothetical protein
MSIKFRVFFLVFEASLAIHCRDKQASNVRSADFLATNKKRFSILLACITEPEL